MSEVWIKQGPLLDGKEGETLFYRALFDLKYHDRWNKEVPAYLDRIARTGDDRSYSILSALTVEYHIDRILELVILDYRELREKREWVFSLKIELLRAMRLIPHFLLGCADASVRNEFAHDMTLGSLDQLDARIKDKLRSAYDQIPVRRDPKNLSHREILQFVVFITVIGVRSYEFNLKLLNDTIRSAEFLAEFNKKAMDGGAVFYGGPELESKGTATKPKKVVK